MTQSKPSTLRLTLTGVGLFVVILPFVIVLLEWTTGTMGINIFLQAFLILFTIIAALVFVIIELPTMLALTINDTRIITKNLLTGRIKEFLFDTFDSFKISIEVGGRGQVRLELILFAQGGMLTSIPLSCIDNIDEIIKELEKRFTDLTEDEFGFLRMIRQQENN